MAAQTPDPSPGRVAYLVNQYPWPSHSFVRREIRAVEGCGLEVLRFSVRPTRRELPDADDRRELAETRAILAVGPMGLFGALLQTVFTRPTRLFTALRTALAMARESDRGAGVHLVYVAEACVLQRWLRQAGVRHLHAHFATNSTTVALLTSLLYGGSFSFTTHGPDDFDRARFSSLGRKVAAASFVAAISEFCKGQIFRWSAFEDWNKVHVVHCGVDQSFASHEVSAVPDNQRFVTVGRLAPQKGQSLLIEAVHRLRQEGRQVELVLVGDGEQRPVLEALVARLGLEQAVRFTGFAAGERVREEILAARAMVSASFAEGLPVVVMEAFILHRPVIATRIAAMSELVEDGRSGWLVAASSIEGLTDAMRAALDSPPDELGRMAAIGASAVAERHDIDREGAKLAELFRGALLASTDGAPSRVVQPMPGSLPAGGPPSSAAPK